MRILTVDNLAYDLNKLPETVSDDMAFSVLDNSNPKAPDFFFIHLIYILSMLKLNQDNGLRLPNFGSNIQICHLDQFP